MEHSPKINSSKMKQTTLEKFLSPPSLKLEGYKIDSVGWLCKNESHISKRKEPRTKSTKKLNKSTKKNAKSWKQLEVTFPTTAEGSSKKQSNTQKKSENILLLTKSESFETYGMVLPSVDKILDNINSIKKDAKALDEYERLYAEDKLHEDSITESLQNLVEKNASLQKSNEDALLDCKHLSQKELKKYMKSNLDYVRNIRDEIEYSLRHEIYKNFAKRSELTYNTSTIVFSSNQIEYLLKKLEDKLDPDCVNTQYIMMVLLPEMCLRIFMDTYEMTNNEAVDYLDWRPCD